MIAFLSEGMPSVGVYLTSPLLNLAAELNIAVIGALFLGSPIPRWMTGWPRSRNSRASSLSLNVGESTIDLASWLILMRFHVSPTNVDRNALESVSRIKSCVNVTFILNIALFREKGRSAIDEIYCFL